VSREGGTVTEFDDEYGTTLESEGRELRGALLGDTINTLSPTEPICLAPHISVHDAVTYMLRGRQPGVLVVDAQGRLAGIFTERDLLTRVVGADRDPRATPLRDVMTADPEALTPRDRVCYAVNRMSVAGYRTVPLVDEAGRPIGVVTVHDFIKWLAHLFPEAVLNLRPGDALKRPHEVDAG
jgi:CBS domain-containing protein